MVTNLQAPVSWGESVRAELHCILSTFWLMARQCIRQPSNHLGRCLHFADGTSARVYRETVVKRGATRDPCVLIVEFRLRGMHGWLHTIFRWESLLNTPLFVGYPGFVSKLWLANDQHNVYRGVYEWDDRGLAEHYARCLWPVLTLGSVTGSIHFRVLPGLRRDDVLANPRVLDGYLPEDSEAWWRIVRACRDEGNRTMNEVAVYNANFGTWWFRLENTILKLLLRSGLKLGTTYILSVKGRKTGAVHSTPVIIVEADGERYLVAPYGPVNWVRNARAAGSVTLTRGRHSEALHIAELGPGESAPVLKKYVGIASATRRYFHAGQDSPVEDFVAEAPGHPVFRLLN